MGSRHTRWLSSLLVFMAVFGSACGASQRVGSERLTEFEEQEVGPRLGQALEEEPEQPGVTAAPLAVGQRATPPTPLPTPTQRLFDVALVADSPFYHPGNRIIIAAGTTLRVTNRDTTPERPRRSFTDSNGAFSSGPLAAGQVWTQRFDAPAIYDIVDEGVTFARARLEVRG